ncbi:hypothetical protein CGLO_13731 [Colletotrichum gloeosporioides Cg-14]|uniref:Uncharacterized protein n=1 Tax=Colletotrichum gloeosporioides (strain Cg-14) TaxID=1237896 RepID=T0K5G3_COLGC|nr:hypothetical protein CGLO_13731 [Colletotrichum gloeosporioides Cg-14]
MENEFEKNEAVLMRKRFMIIG